MVKYILVFWLLAEHRPLEIRSFPDLAFEPTVHKVNVNGGQELLKSC